MISSKVRTLPCLITRVGACTSFSNGGQAESQKAAGRALKSIVRFSSCGQSVSWRWPSPVSSTFPVNIRSFSSRNNDDDGTKVDHDRVSAEPNQEESSSATDKTSKVYGTSSNQNKPTDSEINNSNITARSAHTSSRAWDVPQYLKDKFAVYQDRDSEIVLDVHEELDQLQQEKSDLEEYQDVQETTEENNNLNYERGVMGVFDVGDLVEALKSENGTDICVIEIPKELLYAEYMVLVSGKSTRHLKAMAEFIKKLHKRKKDTKDVFIIVQGQESDNWFAVDMGNIVLHMFLPSERAKYDIETLWTVGSKYDENCKIKEDAVVNKFQEQINILNNLQPLTAANSVINDVHKM